MSAPSEGAVPEGGATPRQGPRRALLRLLPLLAIVAVGLWFLGKASGSVELELVLAGRAEGLQSLTVELTLLPDELPVRHAAFFFSARAPAPPVVVLESRLQRGRRYRIDLMPRGGEGEGADAVTLSREFAYEGESSLRLTF